MRAERVAVGARLERSRRKQVAEHEERGNADALHGCNHRASMLERLLELSHSRRDEPTCELEHRPVPTWCRPPGSEEPVEYLARLAGGFSDHPGEGLLQFDHGLHPVQRIPVAQRARLARDAKGGNVIAGAGVVRALAAEPV